MVYRITHTTGTGRYDGGSYSGSYFFTVVGELGQTGSYDCPAKRGSGRTSSCSFQDQANIGRLVQMKIRNANADNWAFTKLFVMSDGDLKAERTSYTWIGKYVTTTFNLAQSGKCLCGACPYRVAITTLTVLL